MFINTILFTVNHEDLITFYATLYVLLFVLKILKIEQAKGICTKKMRLKLKTKIN